MTTVRLFPRLPRHIARPLADELSCLGAVVAAERACFEHEAAQFGPTGGHRVLDKELDSLGESVRKVAENYNFPIRPGSANAARFDAHCAILLHDQVAIPPTEAAREDVWSFLGCVLMPDVVRWRWGGKKTPSDRFIGGDRGLRNTFGRLWWRAELLRDDWWPKENSYELLSVLGEDEIVGFVERPRAIVSRLTAVAVAREVLEAEREGGGITRMELFRDVMKRFLRRGAFITYEALNSEEMRVVAGALVQESLTELARFRARAS